MSFRVTTGAAAVCEGRGTLPLTFEPGGTDGLVRLDPQAPLRLTLFTEPESPLWERLGDATGILLDGPRWL